MLFFIIIKNETFADSVKLDLPKGLVLLVQEMNSL